MTYIAPFNSLSIGEAVSPLGRPHFLARRRYQLIGAVLFGVLAPALLHDGLHFKALLLDPTTIGTFGAVLVGAYLLRRMTSFPGTSTVRALLPAFGLAFTGLVVVFFFARLDYSRFQFIGSFIGVTVWFAVVGLIEPRVRRACLLLLPFGKAARLMHNQHADWVLARNPSELPSGVRGVVADLNAEVSPAWQQLLARAALNGLPVYHWKQVAESLSGKVDIEHLSENTLGSLLPSSIYLKFKRLVDTVGACLALPLALPIVMVAAACIKLEDGGPVIYRAERMGFRGKPFVMLKLRTMKVAAADGPAFTEADDPRVTRVGRILRKYRIDELPQIVNILAGHMSWIGPRPESIDLAEWYEGEVPFYSYRHIVRPGITGWAQTLQGNVAKVAAATEKLRFDFYYIKYFSPWLDVLIAARTVRAVLTGFGSR